MDNMNNRSYKQKKQLHDYLLDHGLKSELFNENYEDINSDVKPKTDDESKTDDKSYIRNYCCYTSIFIFILPIMILYTMIVFLLEFVINNVNMNYLTKNILQLYYLFINKN
jgi:ABC-type protease/lipase transport system fused ATPase/permease subunit